jgi:phosphatidylglycerophosphatase A
MGKMPMLRETLRGRSKSSETRPLQKWIVTFFGAGFSPVAPGTAGSLLASILLYGAYEATGAPTYWAWQPILLIGLAVFSALSVGFGPWAIAYFGREDPGPFVLDEVAGICLANVLLPTYGNWRQAWVILIAFVLFRVFDVSKPPPARQLERLPAGWGILLDDLAAAMYANIVGQLLLRLFIHFQ